MFTSDREYAERDQHKGLAIVKEPGRQAEVIGVRRHLHDSVLAPTENGVQVGSELDHCVRRSGGPGRILAVLFWQRVSGDECDDLYLIRSTLKQLWT